MRVVLHGAAQEVTGSCTLVETEDVRFLVDCGMFQGGRNADRRNRAPFAFDPSDVGFVILTHAHMDHSGLLPKMWRDGFRGPIYTTVATAKLLAIMLRDSASIQASDAKRAQRTHHVGDPTMEPIYSMDDVEAVLDLLITLDYGIPCCLHDSVRLRLRDAGHILGSTILEIWVRDGSQERKLVFSGDLGQPGRPILRGPFVINDADFLFVESTYGDRLHKNLADTLDELVDVVNDTLQARKGNIIVPAFAVGRTQELIYYFHHLTRQGRLGGLNLFVDSPMATAVTRVTQDSLALFDDEAKELAAWHADGKGLPNIRFLGTAEESRALNSVRSGAVIIAGSGMCTAGRIKHHLLHNLGRRENAVLITGFQARGTLGRRLVDGVENVRIFGHDVAVRASVHTLGGFSAHADQTALLSWLGGFQRSPLQTFVMHGEPRASVALADRITQRLGWSVNIPTAGEVLALGVDDSGTSPP